MSPDEVFALLLGLLLAGIAWGLWAAWDLRLSSAYRRGSERVLHYATPLACALLLFWVLASFSAEDVRDDPKYLLLYQVLGAAWVGIGSLCLPLFGLSARDDVLERHNPAAAWAIAGAQVALTLCYAGGNIGNGPGWWVVLFCALFASAALLLLWLILERALGWSELITVERDLGAGLRLGGFLCASGLVLGRAVAGDWIGAPQTLVDLADRGWPVFGLALVAWLFEHLAKARKTSTPASWSTWGLLPAGLQLGLAALHLCWLGDWS